MLPNLQGKVYGISVFLIVFLLPMGWMNISSFFWKDNTDLLLQYNYVAPAPPGFFWKKFFIVFGVIIVVGIIYWCFNCGKLLRCYSNTPCVF